MSNDYGNSKDYIIATSSTSDLPREWLDEHHVPFISYSYTVNGNPCQDDCSEESRSAMFTGMRRGDDLRTSMINEYTYYEFFKGLLETGKDVLFLDMSEKMSVSYVNANSAAQRASGEFPSRTLRVLDTRCISGGLGLLVTGAVKHMEAGESFDQVTEWCETNKLKIAHRFTVDDLNYLKRGGRVSNTSALVGSILNIKPVLYVPDGGTLDVVKKARGRRAALHTIRDSVLNDLSGFQSPDQQMFILHADCMDDAQWLRDQIVAAYPEFPEIRISSLGVVIGAHTGPGLLTVFYFCDGRKPM